MTSEWQTTTLSKQPDLSSNCFTCSVWMGCVLFVYYMSISVRSVLQFVPIECQSLPWIQQWLHSLWPRLQAPVGRETVNKPQLAASLGVTQQPGCLIFFFFFPPLAVMGQGQLSYWEKFHWLWVEACVDADLQEVVQVVLLSHGTHGRPLWGSHLLHQHLDLVKLQDAFGPRQILEVLSKCNKTWEPEKNHTTLSPNPDNNLLKSDALFWQEQH